MDDLMGATHIRDIDYYLEDDATYSHLTDNNLRNPDNIVGEGERYGYDYRLGRIGLKLYSSVAWSINNFDFWVGAQMTPEHIWRRGYFEKELFPGEGSYGRSNVVRFNPYRANLSVGYAIATGHHIRVSALAANALPEAEDMFLNPQYNNRVVDNPGAERWLASEAEYKFTSAKADVIVTAYYNSTRNGRRTMRLYDDLSRRYCDVDISRLGTIAYGVEMAAELRFTPSLRASLSAAAGRYIFADNPLVTHYDDKDNSVVSASSVSYMGDCYVGGAPQLSAAAELTYLNYRGWIASLGAQMAAERYVEPSVIRRTERVAIQGSTSEEIYHRFVEQRRLDDAITVDASLSRWFNVGHSRLSLTLSVRNLLGSRDIVYGGYESSRIRNYMSGAQRIYLPQDDVLTYAYPRTFYGVISWKF